MSVLTRIKNNQITDSTIWANAKIIPGSIVGSLFSPTLTMTSDVTITGNLTVQGASTYLTVASTNTYVNDPLIVLNNAFAGSNSYDLGFVFNRGSDPNKAFYWDESSDEFRLITTTETGTTYGSITAETNYEKLRLGNLVAQYDVSTITLTATGFINTTANVSAAIVNAGALNATGTTTLAAVNSSGFINTTGNISGAVVNAGALNATGTTTLAAVNSSGFINTTANVSAAVVNTGALNATGTTTLAAVNSSGFIQTTGNISGAVINGGAINSTGLINTSGNVSASTINAAQFNTTGNLSATQVSAQTLKASGLTSGRVVFTSTGGLLVDNAGITFSANTLTVGGAQIITIDGATATIATTGTNQDLTLAPNGTGVVDFSATTASNLADPTLAQDAVTKAYLESAISSDVTNIQNDDTRVVINDTGIGTTGNIVVDVDDSRAALFTVSTVTLSKNTIVSNSTASTTTSSGALVVTGGVGIGGQLTGAVLKSTDTTQSTSTTTGAIITAGGLGVAKNLNVGGDATVTGNLTVQGVLTAIQSTTLDVSDLQITLARGAGGSAAADGAGINVDYGNVGANITYTHATLSWNFNKPVIGSSYANFGGNVLATNFVGGGVNVSGNISAAVLNGGAINSTGFINTTGNVSAAVVIAGQFNTTGNLVASEVSTATLNATGLINTLGNLSASQVSTATLNATGLINTLGNISAAVINTGALNSTGLTTTAGVNSSANILATGGIFSSLTVNGSITSTGFFNTTGNISGAVVNTGALNATGTTTLVAVNSTGFINTTANVSAAVVNTGALNATGTTTLVAVNSTGFINTTANISGAVVNTATLNATGVASITNSTDTSSLSSGALIVTGGTAVGKTLWVGEGAVINSTRAAEAFQVYGATGNNGLIYADTAKSAIVFSDTGNTTVQNGVITKFDSTGAIRIPVGSTAQRPGAAGNVDVAGLLRFSSTTNNLEFYDGSSWTAAGSVFTIVTTNSFSGNGVQTAFTLSSSSTTAATIVAVNGVVQIPTTAYSVSGTTLTFTEAPAAGDAVDARVFITTSTVSAISSGNGYNTFDVATAPYANITAGTSSPTVRVSVDGVTGTATFTNDVVINGNLTVKGGSSGNINIGDQDTDKVQLIGEVVFDQAVPVQVTNTNLTQLDSFSTAAYSSAIYEVQVKQVGGSQANVSFYKAHVVQDTINSYITTYGIVNTGNAMGSLSSNVVSGTTRLWYTPAAGQSIANVKVKTTYIV